MRMWVQSLALLSGSGIAMSCDVGHRSGSDLVRLWLWPADVAPIQPLVWELPYAMGTPMKSEGKKKKTENLKIYFSKDLQIANRHMKRCSTLLLIREMQIKTTMWYSPHTGQNDHQKTTDNKCWERVPLLHCWWECKLVQLLYRTVWRLLKKLKIELSYSLAIPLLGMYLEKKDKNSRSSRRGAVTSWKWMWLETMKLWVWSLALLSGLRIRRCHELWCRSQMWLGHCTAVAVV